MRRDHFWGITDTDIVTSELLTTDEIIEGKFDNTNLSDDEDVI